MMLDTPHQAAVINYHIREWSEMFPYDFRDERMMRSLKEMTQTCAGLSPVSLRHYLSYTTLATLMAPWSP